MMLFIKNKSRFFIFGIIIIISWACIFPSVFSLKTNINMPKNILNSFDGFILFTPEYSKETFVINNNEEIVHHWSSDYLQAFGAYLLENGDLLRSSRPYFNPTFFCGGINGRVEKFSWNGTLLWGFDYSNDQHCLHHDIEPLPNGNILMIAWEYKTAGEAIEAGRNPNTLPDGKLFPDHILEVEPEGSSDGNIVWEWHVWDHLIQDHDSSKNNYGVVKDHPELIDINYGQTVFGDWNHINSVDYNEEFDQILLSVKTFNEIWVIDHSTTTEEAAGHIGGNSGKGGDLLYRWGNPKTYRAGTTDDQKFFGQHDARWIHEGCPGEGNILVFNNGYGRPGGYYSSVEEISTPVDSIGNYNHVAGSPYEPLVPIWIYKAEDPYDFYASYLSGAQRLKNGNTIICNGPIGNFFEVNTENEIIWEYTNPYPNPLQNYVFKFNYIPIDEFPTEDSDLNCEGSINWVDVKAGEKLYDAFRVENIGNINSFLNWKIESFPSWGSWSFNPEYGENLTPEDGLLDINVTVVVPNIQNKKFDGSLRIVNQKNPSDFDVIPIHITTSVSKYFKAPRIFQHTNKLNQRFLVFIQELFCYYINAHNIKLKY